jgi:hypothetical protein
MEILRAGVPGVYWPKGQQDTDRHMPLTRRREYFAQQLKSSLGGANSADKKNQGNPMAIRRGGAP